MGKSRSVVVLGVVAAAAFVGRPASAQDPAPPQRAPETPPAAADEQTLAIRRDLEALVRRVEYGSQWDDDSPTALVTRLVSADEATLRAVCREAWENGAQYDDEPAGGGWNGGGGHLRWTLDLLFGRRTRAAWHPEGTDDRLIGADGAVRIAQSSRFSACVYVAAETLPAFEDVVGTRRPIRLPPADGSALLAAVFPVPAAASVSADDARRRQWHEKLPAWCDACAATTGAVWATRTHLAAHDDDVAMLVGELCGQDAAALRRLIEGASAPGVSVHALTALGWSRSPAAVPILERELTTMFGGGDVHRWRAWCLLRALHRADAGACRKFVRGLSPGAQDLAVQLCRRGIGEPIVLGWLHGASRDPAAQAAALRRVAAVARAMSSWDGTFAARLLDVSETARREHDDAEVRAAADAIDEAVLAPPRGDAAAAPPTGSVRLPNYPTLARWSDVLRAEAAAGRIVWAQGLLPLWDTDRRIGRGEVRPGFWGARPWRSLYLETDSQRWGVPFTEGIEVTGTILDDGLRMHMRNGGHVPVSLNPIALCLVTAVREDSRDDDGGRTRRLHLILGDLTPPAAVPASALVVIPPRGRHHWTIPLLDEDRAADHIAVTIRDRFRIHGVPAAQPIVNLPAAIVK